MQEKNKPINKASTVKAVGVLKKSKKWIDDPKKLEEFARSEDPNLRTINELNDLKKYKDSTNIHHPSYGTFKEHTVGTTAHRKKYPDRYKKEPLVKQFRSDSPDTYLSHPSQQKGMLLATIEDAKPKPKKTNLYADVKIPIPVIDHALLRQPKHEARDAALEKVREFAFRKIPDPDANNGIGSFRNTIGKELRANNSKRDWEKINRVTYRNDHD